jgi:hypothetical protein
MADAAKPDLLTLRPASFASKPSCPRKLMAGLPRRPWVSTENGMKGYPFGSSWRYVRLFSLSLRAAAAPSVVAAAARFDTPEGCVMDTSTTDMPDYSASRMSPRAYRPAASVPLEAPYAPASKPGSLRSDGKGAPPPAQRAPMCSPGAGVQRASGGCREGQASGPGPPGGVPGARPLGGMLVLLSLRRLRSGRKGCLCGFRLLAGLQVHASHRVGLRRRRQRRHPRSGQHTWRAGSGGRGERRGQ